MTLARLRLELLHEFENLDLDVRFDGEFRRLALFGPSGAGKTTVLKILSGLLNPQHGRVELDGTTLLDTVGGVNQSPRQRPLGYLMQGAPLFPHLGVEENLEYSNRLSVQDPRGKNIIELLEIGSLLSRRPGDLSGGERRRVALAQTFLGDPRLLLLDEPLTGLNETLRRRILPDLRILLQEWDRPAIVVSHRPEVVQALCDRVVPLNQGQARESLSPPDLFHSESHRALRVIGATNYYRARPIACGQAGGLRRVETEGGLSFWIRGIDPTGNALGRKVIEFGADEPVLGRNVSGELSPRNDWKARILRLEEEENSLLLSVAINDERMWVRITKRTGREFDLAEGETIEVFLKTQSIHVHPA